MSSSTTKNAWKEREELAKVVLAVAERRQRITERLRQYRLENARPEDQQKDRPLPQEQAARRAEVDHRQWQRWEAGETMPHPRNLQKVADKLGIPVEEFFGHGQGERGDTPDLAAALNDNGLSDLRAQLDRIENMLASVIDALGIEEHADVHPLEQINQIAAALPGLLATDDGTVATTATRPEGS